MNQHSTARGSIVGVVSAVPDRVITNADCPDPAAADEAAKLTGVHERRWVKPGQTARTLCTDAARHLLYRMGWAGADVDLIVYVTQTPESAVPADVFRIAADLGAPTTCVCLQINWSCSGYVYGLWTAMRLLDPGKRALLLVGDATSTIADPGDRATAPLFGDAGSATAITGNGPEQHFVMGSDGSGAEKLCQPTHWLQMDGAAVFNFTLRTVPRLVTDLREFGEPDLWLLHQANGMILKHLAKKAAIPKERVPMNIARFGNCSCASIPLVLCGESLAMSFSMRVAMLGFGAGFAWAGASIEVEALRVAELVEV